MYDLKTKHDVTARTNSGMLKLHPYEEPEKLLEVSLSLYIWHLGPTTKSGFEIEITYPAMITDHVIGNTFPMVTATIIGDHP